MGAEIAPTGVAMPEWLTRQDITNGAWTVQEGAAARGEAWTEINHRVMRVPFGGDETNRVIRAHEMMHAKVSPLRHPGPDANATPESVTAAEEFRVNTLIKSAGFDVDYLVDGSERRAGTRLAEMKDYAGLVRFVAATAGGKACKDLLRGIKMHDADLAKGLRELEKSLVKRWTKAARRSPRQAAETWSSTIACDTGKLQGLPKGFVDVTIPIAQNLDAIINALRAADEKGEPVAGNDESDDTQDAEFDPNTIRDLANGQAGQWADLVFGETRLTRKVRGSVGRTRIAANNGINPRRMNRMLTDPQRRVFDRTRRANGGIVIIDLSASMHLSSSQVQQMMESSPGCTIIGYSHKRRHPERPNVWVLAKNGRRVADVPEDTAGNGVDGPAVEWAIKQAKRGEPIVWVSDGQVTSNDDDTCDNLDIECAHLVRSNNLHMAHSVPAGVAAVAELGKGRKLPVNYTGNVRRAAQRLGYIR
jgi:hypothetical protein